MVFHGIPILVCENINPPPAAAHHLLYTVYPPQHHELVLHKSKENSTDKKEVRKARPR